jgi:hypothetical protein
MRGGGQNRWTAGASVRSAAQRYRRLVQPLGFRFEVDAVLLDGIAHRPACRLVPALLPHDAMPIRAAGVYRSERCPRECPRCRPPFETLLSHQLDRPLVSLPR